MMGASIEARGRLVKAPLMHGAQESDRRMAYGWLAVPVMNTSCDLMRQAKGPVSATQWVRLVAFESAADLLMRCRAGDVITVTGALQKNDRIDKAGVRHTGIECKVS